MKKLLAATLMALSLTVQAESPFSDVLAASVGYVSNNTNVSVAINIDAGDMVGFASYSAITRSFCGISSISTGELLEYGYNTVFLTAPADDFYMVVCIKTSGLSSDVVLAVAEPSFFGIQSRSIEQASDSDIQALENAFNEILN